MTPEEIASELVKEMEQAGADVPGIAAAWRPYFDLPLLYAYTKRVSEISRQDHRQALSWMNLAEAMAEAMDTEAARARVAWIRGNIYQRMNRYEEAMVCWQQAEAFYAAQGEHLKVAGLQINRVGGLRDLGNYPAAVTLAEQARLSCLAIGEPADAYLANLESALGWLQQDMGDPQAALATYERARAIFERQGNVVSRANAEANRAYVLQAMDRFEEAESLLHQVRAVMVAEEYPAEIARTDLKLGIMAYKRGQYQEALHFLETAHDGFAALSLPVEVATVDNHHSFVYRNLNLLEEQVHLAERAGRIFKQQKMGRDYITCLLNQGQGYQRLNLLPQAEEVLARARQLIWQQGAKAKLLIVDSDRAELALAAGRPDRARRLARRVEKQTPADENPSLAARLQLILADCALAQADWQTALDHAGRALALAEAYQLSPTIIQAHYRIGQTLEAGGRLEEAQQSLQQAVETTEQLRAFLLHDEFQIGFMEDKQPIYAAQIRLAHHLLGQAKAKPADLLYSLSQAFTAPLLHAPAETPPTSVQLARQERLAALRQSWHWYQSKLDTSNQLEATNTAERAAWQQQLHQIEQELGILLRLDRRPDRGQKANRASVVSPEEPAAFLAEMQARLSSGDVLLLYYVVEGTLHALLIGQADVQIVPDLVRTSTLDRWLRAWRFSLHQSSLSLEASQSYLARLYQLLLAPLGDQLDDCGRLYLVLPPEWHDLPLAAAFDGRHYLIEFLQLVYLSTPNALPGPHVLPGPHALPGRHSPPLPSLRGPDCRAVVVGLSDEGRLPYAVAEAEQVVTTLAAHGWTTAALLEEEAAAGRLRTLSANCHLLHLATHALFRPDNPIFSSIRLADGRITVADLYEMMLAGRPLVVLSACETGRGRPRGGGLLGMGRALLAAGASGLVATLWPVSDSASAGVMAAYYQALLSGADEPNSAAALQDAQREAIAQGQLPFYWAAFICVGG